ncbi:hypothetical protein FBY04_105178 [Pseudomonas sp. SJZ080]|uniref:hypothetical protein n=1 Tax=Pseudomonas sp. SJZ080 TaxID=2572888 RepID=UPI00119BC5FA|nr:hypothetical protein [Pseudomonas sp. SJZ080]TWC57707.1 hypothetical protein FBY04_105178 [Pseudomonas sp. SJZ080]
MSKKESFPFNGRDRAQYRAFRSSIQLADLNAPVPGAANPFKPALAAGGPQYLPYAYFNKPLEFDIPEFADQYNPTGVIVVIQMTVDGTVDADEHKFYQETPITITPIPMNLHLAAKDQEGLRKVSYTLDFGGNTAKVIPLEYRVDKVPPSLDKIIELPQSVRDYGIGPEDFEEGKTVSLTYQNYTGKKLGDLVKCFIGPSRSVPTEVASVRVDEANIGTPMVFALTAAHVNGFDGEFVVWCEGENYPGVPATPSALTNVSVFKELRPVVLAPLYVPQIVDEDDDTLGIEQLFDRVGAGLEVPYPNFSTAMDKLVISIDGVAQPEQTMNGFPSVRNLDNQALLAQGHGRRQVELGYRIKRGNKYFPTNPITRLVWLDVRKPADPIDPADPKFLDPSLLEPWFQGPKSIVKNRLTAADEQDGGPVTGFLEFHRLFKPGDKARFALNSRESPIEWVHPLDGSEDRSKPITFDLPWPWLKSLADDDTTQIQVLVQHDVNFNEAHSPVANGFVRTTPIELVVAGFRHLHTDPRNGVVCSSLRRHPTHGVVGVVRIPGDTRMTDIQVKLTFGGYPTSAAIESELIPGSSVEVPFTPNLTQATNGFDMYVPYQYLLATRIGYGRADYTVVIEEEIVFTKGPVVRVNMSSGEVTCDLTDVTDPTSLIGK